MRSGERTPGSAGGSPGALQPGLSAALQSPASSLRKPRPRPSPHPASRFPVPGRVARPGPEVLEFPGVCLCLCLGAVRRRDQAPRGSASEAVTAATIPDHFCRGTEARPFAGWRRCYPCPSRMMTTNHPNSICLARSQAGLGAGCRVCWEGAARLEEIKPGAEDGCEVQGGSVTLLLWWKEHVDRVGLERGTRLQGPGTPLAPACF